MIIGNLNTGDYTVVTFALAKSSVQTTPANADYQNRSRQLPAQDSGLKVQVATQTRWAKGKLLINKLR